MNKEYYVYILTNKSNTTLYVGVTSNLEKRIFQHKNKLIDGFTKNYNLNKLVYFEHTSDVKSAIAREKQLKSGSRKKKIELIEKDNSIWKDLSVELGFDCSKAKREITALRCVMTEIRLLRIARNDMVYGFSLRGIMTRQSKSLESKRAAR